jgi:hypothetical protein
MFYHIAGIGGGMLVGTHGQGPGEQQAPAKDPYRDTVHPARSVAMSE